ncbi:MAG TPA: CAP domain-containing protein, partial [Polyangiaceae bacterium]
DGGGNGTPDAGTPPDMDSGTPVDTDSGDSLTQARVQCVQIINQYRATLSPPSPPLTEDTAQESCVDSQAQKDYTANTAHSAFGDCSEFAQDECPGWPGPPASINTDCFKSMWDEGPPPAGQDNHWLNMSNAKYTKVACGYYQTPKGDWWTTQDFW